MGVDGHQVDRIAEEAGLNPRIAVYLGNEVGQAEMNGDTIP